MNSEHPISGKLPQPTFDGSDLFCISCQYNLRTLESSSKCPKCGVPVSKSLDRKLVASLDPKWVESLRKGSSVFGADINALFSVFGLIMIASWIFGFETGYAMGFIMTVVTVYALIGLWKFSAPPGIRVLSQSCLVARKIVRMSFVSLVTIVACVGLASLHEPFRDKKILTTCVICFSPVGFLGGILFASFGYYCREVAGLFEDHFTRSKAKTYLRGFLISWCLFAIFASYYLISRMEFAFLASIPGVIGELAFIPLILALPTYLKSRILECVEEAKSAAVTARR